MGDTSPGNDATADPHRMWRRPAPGDGPPVAGTAPDVAVPSAPSIWEPGYEAAASSAPSLLGADLSAPGDLSASSDLSAPPAHDQARLLPAADRTPVADRTPTADRASAAGGRLAAGGNGGDHRRGRWWPRVGVLAAVVVVAGTVVALASGNGENGASRATSVPATTPSTADAPTSTTRRQLPTQPPTTAPPTTVSGPGADPDADTYADLAPEDDPRVLLVDLPDGFEAARATWIDAFGGQMGGLLFVSDQSTWADGPWLRIEPDLRPLFVGPVTTLDIGGAPAWSGRADDGSDAVMVDAPGAPFVVAARGLPPGTPATIAAAVTIGDQGALSLPATVLPDGLHPASGDVAASLGVRRGPASNVAYRGPAGENVIVFASIAQPGHEPLAAAPFFLRDVAYVTIDGDRMVIGTYRFAGGSTLSVQWRHAGVDIEISAYGMDRAALLDLATRARTRVDGGWTEPDWDRAARGTAVRSPDPVEIASDVPIAEGSVADVAAARIGDQLSWWTESSSGVVSSHGRTASPIVLDVAASSRAPFDAATSSYVVAIVLGDESLAGATLRLRTGTGGDGTGTNGAARDSSITPIGAGDAPPVVAPATTPPDPPAPDDAPGSTAPAAGPDDGSAAPGGTTPGPGGPADDLGGLGYAYGTAVAAEWSAGSFVAELIAADGVTVLATATEADLP